MLLLPLAENVIRIPDLIDLDHTKFSNRINQTRRHDFSASVDPLSTSRNVNLTAHGDDHSVLDQDRAISNRRTAHRVNLAVSNGDGLSECGRRSGENQDNYEKGYAH